MTTTFDFDFVGQVSTQSTVYGIFYFLLFLLSLSSSILMIWNETSHVVRHSRFANNTPHFFTGNRFYYGLLHPFHTVSYLSDSYIGIFPIESFFILNCKPCVLHRHGQLPTKGIEIQPIRRIEITFSNVKLDNFVRK